MVRLSAPHTGRLYDPRDTPVKVRVDPMVHSAAWRTKFMKYPNDPIGSRTPNSDLCSFSSDCPTASATVHRILKHYSERSTVKFWLGWQGFPWQMRVSLSGVAEYSCVLWYEAVCCLVNGFRPSEQSWCTRIQEFSIITRIGSCPCNTKALLSFETSRTTPPATQHHIAEYLTSLRHYSVRYASLQLLCSLNNINVAQQEI